MSLDSLFILSHLGEILIQKNYKHESKSAIAQDFYSEYLKVKSNNKMENIYPLIKIKNSLCVYLTASDLLFLAIITEDVPILTIFSILFNLIDTMKNAFSFDLSTDKIRNNFSSILVMLDHYLDYGFPLITQKYILESMIKPYKMIDKLEETFVGKNSHAKDNIQFLEKYVEAVSDVKPYSIWRISDYKASEELYFDVIEYIDCILDKNNQYLHQNINGEIKVNCQLSGNPEVNVFLNIPNNFYDYAIHDCLFDRIDAIEKEKLLNFIPPTGNFVLFNYSFKNQSINLPFEIIHTLKITEKEVNIALKAETRLVRGIYYQVEEFHIKILMPPGLMKKDSDYSNGSLNINDDSVLWKIGELKKDFSSKLNLKFEIKEGFSIENKAFVACAKFQILGYSFSGTKIEKADVKNGSKGANITKKARNITKSGYFEIRMN